MSKYKPINWNGFSSGGLKPFYDQNAHDPEFIDRFHGHYSKLIPNFYAEDEAHSSAKQVKADSSSTPSSSTTAPDNRRSERKQPVKQEVSSTVPEEIVSDVDMPLVGTALGQGGAGDGNSNSEMPLYVADQPYTNFGKKVTTYKKVHRFITFGIAHNWISELVGAENVRTLTTALAEIPWQKPFLYLNPSEFALLPSGAHVKELRVTITCRGVRIGFETAAVDTTLATLNQIQNIQVAVGLNKTGWGLNQSYDAFDATQSMKPTSTAPPAYLLYPQDMYGDPNASIENFIPNHQIGFKMPLYNYFCLITKKEAFGGCPPLVEYIEFMDGKTAINKVVKKMTWSPSMGPITTPLKHYRWGLPTSVRIDHNGIMQNSRATSVVTTLASTGSSITNSEISNNTTMPISGDFSYQDDIDKSQLYRQGPWGQYKDPKIQPSIHVGLQAIPALTTTVFFTPINKWSDSQCDWEVTAEMDVVEYTPTKLPHATTANVPAGDQHFRTLPAGNFIESELRSSYAGLYATA